MSDLALDILAAVILFFTLAVILVLFFVIIGWAGVVVIGLVALLMGSVWAIDRLL